MNKPDPAVLPTADAPTAEEIATGMKSVQRLIEWAWKQDRPIPLSVDFDEATGFLNRLSSHLPSLLAADADRQRDKFKRDFLIVGADWMAGAICRLVDAHVLDARSECGDALLDYASMRFGDRDPIGNARKCKDPRASRSPEGAP